jgi:16S rRNA (cytosine967-C5)-methyltransferase
VLARVSRRGGTLAQALAVPAVEALDERERALLHELVLGTLRRRGWLDHVLGRLVHQPLERVVPGVLDALRLGAYQLLFTRVPSHAALSESVDLARAVEPRAAGFANAVLRRLQREGAPPEPDANLDVMAWLTSFGSLPRWLAERWANGLGPVRAVERARALLDAPPVHFRTNPRRPAATLLDAGGVRAQPAFVPGSLTLVEGRLSPFLESGIAYVQDVGSQLVGALAATEGTVLDVCAAPGGKSLLMADLGEGRTRVVAADASPRRVRTLESLRRRWGAAEVRVVAADGLRPPFMRPFDAVLLDAPCSGLGTLARHPDIRWRCGAGEPERQQHRQRALLEAQAPLLRPGGRLVYATCSLEPEENEEVVEPFLQAHAEFEIEDLPDWAERLRQGRFLRLEPESSADGFFVARLRRR